MLVDAKVRFATETPDAHASIAVQCFIEQELYKPNKMWVYEVLSSKRETDFVKLRTPDFVLLPDTNANKRQFKPYTAPRQESNFSLSSLPRWAGGKFKMSFSQQQPAPLHSLKSFNWLAISADSDLRSLRDLRGCHAEMLEDLLAKCTQCIAEETGFEAHDVMAFINYPPSVYRLHIHFCAPFFCSSAYDSFRMHSLASVINNLRICPDYYALSTFVVPVHVGSDFHRALVSPEVIPGQSASPRDLLAQPLPEVEDDVVDCDDEDKRGKELELNGPVQLPLNRLGVLAVGEKEVE